MKRPRFSTLLLAILSVSAATLLPANAQESTHLEEHLMQNSVAAPFIPTTHQLTSRRDVSVDGTAATLTRYVRKDDRNNGIAGEHFSTIIAANGTLKGFANI